MAAKYTCILEICYYSNQDKMHKSSHAAIVRPHPSTPQSSLSVTHLQLAAAHFTYPEGWNSDSRLSAPGIEPGSPPTAIRVNYVIYSLAMISVLIVFG